MTYFQLRFRLAENYVIPSLLYFFTLLIIRRFDSTTRPMDKFHGFLSSLFFPLYSFFESKGTPARRNKNRCCCRLAEQGRCKDDYHDDVAASLAPGNFREERRERVYAGGEEKDTKGEGA